jgi:hypothetical protein
MVGCSAGYDREVWFQAKLMQTLCICLLRNMAVAAAVHHCSHGIVRQLVSASHTLPFVGEILHPYCAYTRALCAQLLLLLTCFACCAVYIYSCCSYSSCSQTSICARQIFDLQLAHKATTTTF